jgi:Zn-dependent protease with chaperone function
VRLGSASLAFSGPGTGEQQWAFGELVAIVPFRPGQPLRLGHLQRPGSRLVVHDSGVVAALLRAAPQLRGGFNARRAGRSAAWIAGIAAALALALYLTVQYAPQRLAMAMPDAWRAHIGSEIEESLVQGAKRCEAAAGKAALVAMTMRLAERNAAVPPVIVNVYDIPITNAFAMAGGRIVVTRELIAKARSADEVAGVLAHEMGHVAHRDSEAQIIRATGLQLLVGLATGGGDSMFSTLASVATILRYSREAEAAADDFALEVLGTAAIDPMGLKGFFERVLRDERSGTSGTWGKIFSTFDTHPGIDERIGRIRPLPPGTVSRPALDDGQWQALKAICG